MSAVVGMAEEEEYCGDEGSRLHQYLFTLFYTLFHIFCIYSCNWEEPVTLRRLIKKYG